MAGRFRRASFAAALVLSVVLVIGGAVLAYLGYEKSGGPDGAVRAYFTALQHGDAPRALSWGAVPDGAHTLLTSTVLKTQQRLAPIIDVKVNKVDRHGSHAVVQVHYLLDFPPGAVPVAAAIAVDEHGGNWRLRSTAVPTQLLLSTASNRASIDGGTVPQTEVLLFPGAVPVTFDSPYLALAPARDSVGFGSSSELDVGVEVSGTGQAAVRAAVGRALRTCLTRAQPSPTCPLPSDRYVPGSIKGTLAAKALDGLDITLSADPNGLIDIEGNVPFTGTYRKLAFDNVAVAGRGTASLAVHARAYAVAPLNISWTSSS